MKVLVETENDKIHEGLHVDSRGRITLGSDYSDADSMSIAITEIDEEDVSDSADEED
jgi:hypothetical protein